MLKLIFAYIYPDTFFVLYLWNAVARLMAVVGSRDQSGEVGQVKVLVSLWMSIYGPNRQPLPPLTTTAAAAAAQPRPCPRGSQGKQDLLSMRLI